MQGTSQGVAHGAPRDAALTRLRFFLIGWVILYHLDLPLRVSAGVPALGPVFRHGYLGVDGFFLLSGFALWLGYGARPPWGRAGIADFLRRRFAKIWPLHALALVALALLVGLAAAAGATIRDPERFGLDDFFLQLFLLNAWETTTRHAWNYPSWALSVEWAGYLAFPLVLAALIRLPRLLLPAVPLLGFAGIFLLDMRDPAVGMNYTLHLGLLRFFLEFATGLGIGRLITEGLLPRGLLWAALLALPIGLWLEWDAVTVLGLAALIPLLRRPVPATAAPSRPDLLLRLGEASFGVYLCWVFIEAGLVLVLRRIDPGLAGRAGLMVAGFLASLVAGWLAWRFVEVPANRWLLRRRARPAAVPAEGARVASGKA
ncbi:acyltransferase family protein [Belnapia rosea]|uniref:Peptidoglycan/LPS O-acetylase OafA/YrhL, contains acyltransferase and SGNH-hydrolase domains n=1 Tax=Belnapia rosea TaxID=938405 RepID=A0A1G6PP36_9PROT|nr:acyltransferase [Belnapia rosea]SDB56133.1 Peptidoglycan/LPS O-acetylase OafA/YrhL, contains acyltransferase and SGNH-hydrolase domains [Belnapia rosea]SDC81147.1 Peptidoglycan/LPS O-acetylase OafA/YrhL, contains acyltransferase and SGNH-hydrolase domains [Belnapia rosea]